MPESNIIDSLDAVARASRAQRSAGRFIYRGQCGSWSLETSLQRACEQIRGAAEIKPLEHALKREAFFLREFQRRAHHYLLDTPVADLTLEWLALMRHHGAPTRLLDCTYSMYVATYFAIQHSEPEEEDAVVWRFDAEWCKRNTISRFGPAMGRILDGGISFANEPAVVRVLLSRPSISYMYPVNPFRLNERLTIQRGVFLWPGNVGRGFQDNLDALSPRSEDVTKFTIPRSSFRAVSLELHAMNISEATLFPGLDGFARSLVGSRRFLEQQRPDVNPRRRLILASTETSEEPPRGAQTRPRTERGTHHDRRKGGK